MTWKQLFESCEALEESLERMPAFGHYESTKHFARIELANTVARAKEILEALANDEALAGILELKATPELRRALENTDLTYDDEVDVIRIHVDNPAWTLRSLREVVDVEVIGENNS